MNIISEKISNYGLLIRELFHLRKFPVQRYAIIVQVHTNSAMAY